MLLSPLLQHGTNPISSAAANKPFHASAPTCISTQRRLQKSCWQGWRQPSGSSCRKFLCPLIFSWCPEEQIWVPRQQSQHRVTLGNVSSTHRSQAPGDGNLPSSSGIRRGDLSTVCLSLSQRFVCRTRRAIPTFPAPGRGGGLACSLCEVLIRGAAVPVDGLG